ncbi:hypothetical protein LS68_000320 [Helicobacter sp. MIT 05-5293]|uniref:uracil-DNA glycosylase family protein n=1 Tax=Helicobacter sp. MIT 05-5293 TaxID=1548149 RepID=UPI00051DAF94|nr:uracil-DNA glycosylase family protein [Helicobacter sp. MIT 05-5293]TLD81524.1 hypothetical protein LS68_000320 [Helicobacter sp. MIT 05-5293]
MKTHILKLLYLKQLYRQALCGEKYTRLMPHIQNQPLTSSKMGESLEQIIQHCSLCNRIKHCKQPSFGIINPKSPICFISEIPLVDEKGQFVQNKSALMLQNIIKNVFCLPQNVCSILSLVKCDSQNLHLEKSEILSCIGYVFSQLEHINAKIYILLGHNVATHILGQNLQDHLCQHKILWHNNKKFLVSYSLNELVKNPSLKKEANNDFILAKGSL